MKGLTGGTSTWRALEVIRGDEDMCSREGARRIGIGVFRDKAVSSAVEGSLSLFQCDGERAGGLGRGVTLAGGKSKLAPVSALSL